MKKIALLALILVLLSTAVVVRYVRPVESDWTWTETIYIRADGSVDPSAAPISRADNITYVLTDNIVVEVSVLSSAIVVERDNVVVDGAGCTLRLQGLTWIGIDLTYRNNVTIKNMEIKAFDYGIWLSYSSNCNISGNNITNNGYGIYLLDSSNNQFWHNNIVINVQQVYIYLSGNASVWDDGYPSGGNYWSDYSGVDEFGGPYLKTGSDGIGDTPYVIDENNQDNYPLMSPWIPEEEVPFWMQWWLWTIVAVVIVALAGAVYFLKKRKPPTPTAPTPSTEGTFQNIHNKDYSETQSTTMRALCSS